MKVRDHMQTDLVVVGPDDSLASATRLLDSRRVGSALVVDDGNLVGILTERDIVRAVAVGADMKTSRVADFMSRMLTTIGPEEPMSTAAETMTAERIRHLPVVEKGRLVGMLSLRDVVRWSLRQMGYDEGHHVARLTDMWV